MGEDAEQGGGEEDAEVCKYHLQAHCTLRPLLSEMLGRQVEHIREDRAVPQANQEKTHAREKCGEREQEKEDRNADEGLPDPDDPSARPFGGEYAREKSTERDADIVKCDDRCRTVNGIVLCFDEKCTPPVSANVLDGA